MTKVRGLSYYNSYLVETNLNFKVTNAKGKEITVGSCASGGRYDALISRFKGADYKGTGMSIGIDRLLYAVNQLGKIKVNQNKPVLVCILDKNFIQKYYEIVNELRANNIASEIYLDQNKNLKKQLQYADRKKLNLAIICGENEFKDNTFTLKNLLGSKGNNQITVTKEKLIDEIRKFI